MNIREVKVPKYNSNRASEVTLDFRYEKNHIHNLGLDICIINILKLYNKNNNNNGVLNNTKFVFDFKNFG